MKTLLRKYRSNEDQNAHSENLLLLANNFGTKEEIREAERQARSRRSCDGPVYDMPQWMASKICGYHSKLVVAAAGGSEP